MYTIQQPGTLTALRNNAQQKLLIVVCTINEYFELTEQHVVQGSCTVNRYCCSSDKIEIGSVISAELKVTLKNDVVEYDGAYFNLENICFEGGSLEVFCRVPYDDLGHYENIPLGIFYVDEQSRTLSTFSLTALDGMMLFDKPIAGIGGLSLLSIAYYCCRLAGVYLSTHATAFLSAFNGDYTLPASLESSTGDISARDVLRWIGEMTASCAYFDCNGTLDFATFPSFTNGFEITEADRYSSDLWDRDITVTGITVTDSQGVQTTAGTQGYELSIENNKLLMNPSELATALSLTATDTIATYRPFSASTLSYPHLWPLDPIIFVRDNVAHNSILTHHTWKLNGASQLKSSGRTETKNGYYRSSLTAQQRAIIERIEAKQDTKITAYQQAAISLNQQTANAMGLYITLQDDGNGGTIYYYHNAPQIALSTYIIKESTAGRAWTTGSNCWNNGNPIWQNGVTANGEMVMQAIAARKISADMLVVGSLKNLQNNSNVTVTGNGIDIYNGKIAIYNNTGTQVFGADANGNLSVTGSLTARFRNRSATDTATLRITNEDYSSYDFASAAIKFCDSGGDEFARIAAHDYDDGYYIRDPGVLEIEADKAVNISAGDNGTVSISCSTGGIGITGAITAYSSITAYGAITTAGSFNLASGASIKVQKDGAFHHFLNIPSDAGLYRFSIGNGAWEKCFWTWKNVFQYNGIETNIAKKDYYAGLTHHREVNSIEYVAKFGLGRANGMPTGSIELRDSDDHLQARIDAYKGTGSSYVCMMGTSPSGSSGVLGLGATNLYWKGAVCLTSSAESKTNISTASSMLDKICAAGIYNYAYTEEVALSDGEVGTQGEPDVSDTTAAHYGLVIGEGYNTPSEVISADGAHIDLYSMIALAWKGIQELNARLEAVEGGNEAL